MNRENQWLKFLETGEDVPLAVKKPVDQRKNNLRKLRAKYGNIPIPTGLAVRMVSEKQQRGIRLQERGKNHGLDE